MAGTRKTSEQGALPRRTPAERRRLCFERDHRDGNHYICQRDLGHTGGHSWRDVDDLTWLDGRVKLGEVDVTDQLQEAINDQRAVTTAGLPQVETPEPLTGNAAAHWWNGDHDSDRDTEQEMAERRVEAMKDEADAIATRRADLIQATNGQPEPFETPLETPRIDPAAAREEVMRATLSTITQPAQQEYAIVHSLEATRLMELAGLIGEMFATNGNGDLTYPDDIRKASDLIHKMAATRGIDLLAESVEVRNGGRS